MRLIDRIALSRAVKLLVDFIIRLVEIFNKKNIDESNPKPNRPKPIKNLLDKVIPWRNK
jgi:hypothetical protein